MQQWSANKTNRKDWLPAGQNEPIPDQHQGKKLKVTCEQDRAETGGKYKLHL